MGGGGRDNREEWWEGEVLRDDTRVDGEELSGNT